MLLTLQAELQLIEEVLVAEGAPQARAEVQAHWLAEADLRGRHSHGIQRLPVIVERMRRGHIDPGAEPAVSWSSPAAARVDGRRGFGPHVGSVAMLAASERAHETGVALAAVHDANHLGIMAPYAELAADAGLIGLALTTSEALVHPWGGVPAMLGTNPLAIAVPATPDPFVLDMATSAVSMGLVLAHLHRGEPLDEGWALDADGRPTTNPAAVRAISPFGGAKGYGLALAIELLVAATTGTALGAAVTGTLDVETVCTKGDLFLCVDTAALGAPDMVASLSSYLDELRSTPAQPGTDGVAIPGDHARERRRRSLEVGIELPDAVWEQIEALRSEAGTAA
jgi:L-2-hydroxycarboxylate dehydrogenase (NAD+)